MISRCRERIQKLTEQQSSEDFKIIHDDGPPTSTPFKTAMHAFSIEEYPTLQCVLNEILKQLKDDKVKLIGVHGTAGTGKTNIMKNLMNRTELPQLFDDVIFVRANENPQQIVADGLHVNVNGISAVLAEKKFLVILDGVKDENYLKKSGITSDNIGNSKVVAVSHSPGVFMWYDSCTLLKVDRLGELEVWQMFKNAIGHEILNRDVLILAGLVCEKCSGLPFLINKLAKSFRLRRDAASWEEAFGRLNLYFPANADVDDLFSSISFCFEQMNKEQKNSFLYASLYPAATKIDVDYLVDCCASLGFFDDIVDPNEGFMRVVDQDQSFLSTTDLLPQIAHEVSAAEQRRFQKIRQVGHKVIGDLVNLSFLDEGKQMLYVSMSYYMREFALSRNLETKPHIVKTNSTTLPLPFDATWIAMIGVGSSGLPDSKSCKELKSLLIQKNTSLVSIPDNYFDAMSELLVLDLYKTSITKLPRSLSKLISLKALYLNACSELKMLPQELKLLTALQLLDIRGSQVPFISSFIGSLIDLKCLRLPYLIGSSSQSGSQAVSGSQGDSESVGGVICKLKKLEELVIEVKDLENWFNHAKDLIEKEVASLEKLTHLTCSFPTIEVLKKFVEKWRKWQDDKRSTSFQIVVGSGNSKASEIHQYFNYKIGKYLKYSKGEGNIASTIEDIKEVLHEVDAFELACHDSIKSFSEVSRLSEVRGILVDQCKNISTIGDGLSAVSYFPNLEILYLRDLQELNSIFNGGMHDGTFSRLHTLVLENCRLVRSIFKDGAIRNFLKLEKLIVRQCLAIDVLFDIKEDKKGKGVLQPLKEVELPLKEVELADLPELSSISNDPTLAWSSLELLKVHKCPKLTSLPFHKDEATKLGGIKCDRGWLIGLKAKSEEVYEEFKSIIIED